MSPSMSKLLSALIDLLSGVLFVLIAFLSARVLLQDHSLVYLCFPLLTSVALAVGFWRGRKSTLPALVVALLITAPLLILALQFFSGRNRPFIIFPIVTFVFVCIGIAFARYRVMVAAIMAVIVIANIGGALVGPQFVHFIVASSDVNEKPVPFTIHLVDGTTISSEALRGNLVVLDFWATWCVPCQRELPLIQRAYQKLETGKGVVFIAVDGVMTDAPEDAGDTAERAIAYFRRVVSPFHLRGTAARCSKKRSRYVGSRLSWFWMAQEAYGCGTLVSSGQKTLNERSTTRSWSFKTRTGINGCPTLRSSLVGGTCIPRAP